VTSNDVRFIEEKYAMYTIREDRLSGLAGQNLFSNPMMSIAIQQIGRRILHHHTIVLHLESIKFILVTCMALRGKGEIR
jgi:hypothetical protein